MARTAKELREEVAAVPQGDEPLFKALRELGNILSAVDVPHGVAATFPRLSQLQKKFFVSVPHQESAVGAADSHMRLHPSDLLLECLAAARAKDWPRFVVLVQSEPLELDLPEGLDE